MVGVALCPLAQGFIFPSHVIQVIFQVLDIFVEAVVFHHYMVDLLVGMPTLAFEVSDPVLERLGCLSPDRFDQERPCSLYCFSDALCR
jgi:hypothetical protein